MVDVHKLTRNTKILAEALARGIFGLTDQGQFEIFNEGMVRTHMFPVPFRLA